MRIEYKKSESTIHPDTVDTTSSKTTVYLRKNIVEKTRDTEEGRIIYFEYEEAKLTKAEYKKYLDKMPTEETGTVLKQLRADIDYVLMIQGLE